MKKEFSSSWISSVQPRKQRKYQANAPLHTRHKFLSAHLSKSLRDKYGKRNLPLRKGDEVLIMRGSFRKQTAKVSSIDLKSTLVILEGIQRKKKDGTKLNVYFHPSSLLIQSLNLDDKMRLPDKKVLEEKKDDKKEEKKTEFKDKSKEIKKNASNKTGNNN
ncbi:50S ribosomal protein L24 [Candidatus Pacearchaeota archaeon]|nr:50S ribosomal protein L24 [Candidatus Pacearchaeota archaeon]